MALIEFTARRPGTPAATLRSFGAATVSVAALKMAVYRRGGPWPTLSLNWAQPIADSWFPSRKGRFLAISASGCGFPCAEYRRTPPRKSLPFLTLHKNRFFLPREPRRPHGSFWMGTP